MYEIEYIALPQMRRRRRETQDNDNLPWQKRKCPLETQKQQSPDKRRRIKNDNAVAQ